MSSNEAQTAFQKKTAQANRLKPIDTSGRTIPSNFHEVARAQTQLLTSQDVAIINNRLLMAGEAIELSREKLFETLFIASSTLQELDQERQIRQRFSNAYEELHVLYRRKVEEVHEMATKCFSLHKELEDAQKTISDCDSALKESKRGLAVEKVQFENRLKDLARERARTGQQIQNVLEEEKSARQRVGELEKENRDLAAREALAIQRANELQKYHQAATNIAADQMSSEEMLSKKCKCWQVAAAYTTASPERSPRAAQRRTSERRVRRSNNRNCKGAMNNGDEIQ